MTPAQCVGVILAEHRRRGSSFEVAWISALRSLPKGVGPEALAQLLEWKEAIAWAKPDFRAAYLRTKAPTKTDPSVLRELALAFASDEPLPLAA